MKCDRYLEEGARMSEFRFASNDYQLSQKLYDLREKVLKEVSLEK